MKRILRGDPVIIAHNARFDRPFFEKIFLDDCHEWACSMQYCDWPGREFSGRGLGVLLQQEGYFFDAHRAYMDCLAVAALLRVVPGSLAEILAPSVKVVGRRELVRCQGDTEGAQVQVGRRQQDLAQDGAGRRRRAGRQARDGIPQGISTRTGTGRRVWRSTGGKSSRRLCNSPDCRWHV